MAARSCKDSFRSKSTGIMYCSSSSNSLAEEVEEQVGEGVTQCKDR